MPRTRGLPLSCSLSWILVVVIVLISAQPGTAVEPHREVDLGDGVLLQCFEDYKRVKIGGDFWVEFHLTHTQCSHGEGNTDNNPYEKVLANDTKLTISKFSIKIEIVGNAPFLVDVANERRISILPHRTVNLGDGVLVECFEVYKRVKIGESFSVKFLQTHTIDSDGRTNESNNAYEKVLADGTKLAISKKGMRIDPVGNAPFLVDVANERRISILPHRVLNLGSGILLECHENHKRVKIGESYWVDFYLAHMQDSMGNKNTTFGSMNVTVAADNNASLIVTSTRNTMEIRRDHGHQGFLYVDVFNERMMGHK